MAVAPSLAYRCRPYSLLPTFDAMRPNTITPPTQRGPLGARGFTLVELMIVVAIIGILAAIALPSYNRYVRESRRVDGQSALHQIALAQEKYRSNNTAYTTNLSTLGVSANSPDGHYALSIPSATTTGFLAKATAQSASQLADSGCTELTLSVSAGVMTTGPAGCWKK